MTQWTAPTGNFSKWNRKILNAYWAIAILTLVTAIVGFQYFSGLDRVINPLLYFINHIIKPTLAMVVVLLLAEASNRFRIRFNSEVITAAGTFITGALVFFHSNMDGVQFLFMIPMIVSAFYFQFSKVVFSFSINVTLFILLYIYHPSLRMHMNGMDFVHTLVALLCCLIIINGIIARGAEMQQSLIETMREQQDLLIKSTLMDKLSKVDALTELYNHKTFHEYLDKLIDQSDQYRLRLHLAIIDIDNFKKINDVYGHWIGDVILKSVYQTIRSSVSADDFAARYGGEEFAVIFTDKSSEDVLQIMETIRQTIASTLHTELDERNVTISIGLKEYIPHSGKEWLFRGADSALYTAKRTGKNKTVVHSEEPVLLSY